MRLSFVRSGAAQLKANFLTALYYDSTRPMRIFAASSSLLLGIWLLLPGDSIHTPTTTLLRLVFGSDERLSVVPLVVASISAISEMINSRRVKTFAAFLESVWWSSLGLSLLFVRFNSLAGVIWLLLGVFSLWVVWRVSTGRD